ncbi:MAG: hypothetical protein K6G52_09165 [Treponemataceae bacterium]|nr:hypothetical protein [Treponemataceae bacterium]
MPKARIFNIMQYVNHPETNEPLLNEDTIKIALAHQTIKQWAYILHDKDVYSQADEEADPNHKKGNIKPPHWHIVMNCNNAMEVQTIAKWFGIAENFVDIPKGAGRDKFLDCVEYLTHESYKQQELGKYRYADEEVHASEGFNWRERLNKRIENKIKYGKDLSDEDQILYDVMYLGKTLRQCIAEDQYIYMHDFKKLREARLEYIRRQEPPTARINYYIYGRGGIGKDLMSRALARALFPQYEKDEDIFFEVGAGKVTFDGYDGQPVIIWSDSRSLSLVKKLGGRENFFNVFETHPSSSRQHVMRDSINLCNVVNIVNGQESYEKFLDNIVKEKKDGEWVIAEDKNQSYRRFPFIIPLHDVDFDMMVNKGFFDNDGTLFTEYYEYNHLRGNMQKVMIACGGLERDSRTREVSSKVVKPITDKHAEVMEKMTTEADEDAIAQILAEADEPLPEPKIRHADGTLTDDNGFMEVDDSEDLPFA